MAKQYLLNQKTLPFRTDFFLAGAPCSLATNSHELLSTSARWPNHFGASPERFLRMEILEAPSSAQEDTSNMHFRGLRHLVFAQIGENNFFTFDLLRRRVTGIVSPQTVRDTQIWDRRLFPITMGVLGITIGIIPIHCACLDLDGDALLLAGVSGAGKSTLSIALTQQGFAFVSDDCTYIAQKGNQLVAHGLSMPVKLLPEGISYFPQLQAHEPIKTLNGEIAFEVDPAEVFQSKVKTSAHPRWLMFLERDSVPGCRFLRCKPEYARTFFESGSERLPEELPQAQKLRSEIIHKITELECWIIRTGDSPQQTAEAISRFCERA